MFSCSVEARLDQPVFWPRSRRTAGFSEVRNVSCWKKRAFWSVGGASILTSPLSLLVHKVLGPSQGLCDVIAGSGSLSNQSGTPSAPLEVTTHGYRPIRGRQDGRVLQRRECSVYCPIRSNVTLVSAKGAGLPSEPDKHTGPSQKRRGERAA